MELRFPDRPPLVLDRPRIAGILNVTPDSFSDGGKHADVEPAVRHGLQMADEGADVIDVGGESTRPGAGRISAEEQIRRVVAPIRRLRGALQAALPDRVPVISVDTTRSDVARAALDAGASMLNDVSAGRDDPAMLALAAERGVPIVLMHMLGEPATMQDEPRYTDVVGEVLAFLVDRAKAAERVGVTRSQIVIDPGIGFGKTADHNLTLLANLHRFAETGYAVMLGTSRKRFIAAIAGDPNLPPEERAPGTAATTVVGVTAGVHLFRVHDVAISRRAADVAHAVAAAGRA